MAVSETYLEFITEQLEACLPVATRRMFGGVGVYSDEFFFALMDDDRLYFKVDDSNRGDFEALGAGPFSPTGDPGQVMQYYEVPIDVIEDRARLAEWARRAVDVARRANQMKRRKR